MKYFISTTILIIAVKVGLGQEKISYASSTFCFSVSDLNASIDWYGSLLGNVEKLTPAEGVVEFQLNATTWLQLFEGPTSTGAILRLEVSKIDQQHQRIQQLGVSATPIEVVPGVVSYFDFKDPDGNLLSFYQLEIP